MDTPVSWPDLYSQDNIESLKAWWRQQRDVDPARAQTYSGLIESAEDFQEHERIFRQVYTASARHPLERLLREVPEPEPRREWVLSLMAQRPGRQWKTTDIRIGLGWLTLKPVSTCLKDLTAEGRIEEIRRRVSGNLLYRLIALPPEAPAEAPPRGTGT
ncbi:hypothetical protein ACSNOH_18430 [Streptomyces sp. URMC 127]|uniref:hypothetical protein n=1 Tax=Streptomyces sp. URMC 127 TaxID=3423402 RepID=UPI003F1A6A94